MKNLELLLEQITSDPMRVRQCLEEAEMIRKKRMSTECKKLKLTLKGNNRNTSPTSEMKGSMLKSENNKMKKAANMRLSLYMTSKTMKFIVSRKPMISKRYVFDI